MALGSPSNIPEEVKAEFADNGNSYIISPATLLSDEDFNQLNLALDSQRLPKLKKETHGGSQFYTFNKPTTDDDLDRMMAFLHLLAGFKADNYAYQYVYTIPADRILIAPLPSAPQPEQQQQPDAKQNPQAAASQAQPKTAGQAQEVQSPVESLSAQDLKSRLNNLRQHSSHAALEFLGLRVALVQQSMFQDKAQAHTDVIERITELEKSFTRRMHNSTVVADQEIFNECLRYIRHFRGQIRTPNDLEAYLRTIVGELRVAVGAKVLNAAQEESEVSPEILEIDRLYFGYTDLLPTADGGVESQFDNPLLRRIEATETNESKLRVRKSILDTKDNPPKGNEIKYAQVLLPYHRHPRKKAKLDALASNLHKKFHAKLQKVSAPLKGLFSQDPPNAFSVSQTWVYWDIAKQLYLDDNPQESSNKYYLGDPFEDPKVQENIVNLHLGWEMHGYCKLLLEEGAEDEVEKLFKPGESWIRAKEILESEVKKDTDKGRGTLSSYLLIELATLLA